MWMPNVEFSHIIVDRGMFHDHMPDSVQNAVEHLYQQLCDEPTDHGSGHTEPNGNSINDSSVQDHHSNTADTLNMDCHIVKKSAEVQTVKVVVHKEREQVPS